MFIFRDIISRVIIYVVVLYRPLVIGADGKNSGRNAEIGRVEFSTHHFVTIAHVFPAISRGRRQLPQCVSFQWLPAPCSSNRNAVSDTVRTTMALLQSQVKICLAKTKTIIIQPVSVAWNFTVSMFPFLNFTVSRKTFTTFGTFNKSRPRFVCFRYDSSLNSTHIRRRS